MVGAGDAGSMSIAGASAFALPRRVPAAASEDGYEAARVIRPAAEPPV